MNDKNFSTNIKVFIKVKSYSSIYLNRFLLLTKEILNTLNSSGIKPVFLPKKIERFTVLKSPHIYKKSREQFEYITYKRVFSFTIVNTPETQKFLYRLFMLLSYFAQGLNLQYKYKIKSL